MAITQALCTSFKLQLLNGDADFSSSTSRTYRMALFTNAATLDASTTTYDGLTNEVIGSGYTAGGKPLTGLVTTTDGTTAFVDFDDVIWPGSSITARGALIYELTAGNPAVAVLDFTEDKITSGGNFVVQIPNPTAADAIIRLP